MDYDIHDKEFIIDNLLDIFRAKLESANEDDLQEIQDFFEKGKPVDFSFSIDAGSTSIQRIWVLS